MKCPTAEQLDAAASAAAFAHCATGVHSVDTRFDGRGAFPGPWGRNVMFGVRWYGSVAEYEAERARIAAMPRIIRKGGSVPEVKR